MVDRKDILLPDNAPEDVVKRMARLTLADRFLDGILIPQIQEGVIDSAEKVNEIYNNFCIDNPGLGDDFDLAHVWRKVELRSSISAHLLENLADPLPNAADNEIALHFLEQLVFDESKNPSIE